MMNHVREIDRANARTAELQMSRWAVAQEVEKRIAREQSLHKQDGPVHPYVTISRETGAGGGEVARRVSEKLSWQLFDRNLLHRMAELYHLSENSLESVDETTFNWLFEMSAYWLSQHGVTQTKYVARLAAR